MRKNRTGWAGEREVDGSVFWETICDGLSYEPAIHCGNFVLCISRGEYWGAKDDNWGIALIDFYGVETGSDEWQEKFDAVYKDIPQQFVWNREAMMERVAQIAEYMDHPNIENVKEAASELYYALLQEETRDCAAI
jgi:hypothetical protein